MFGAVLSLFFLLFIYMLIGLSKSLGLISKDEAIELKDKANNIKANED